MSVRRYLGPIAKRVWAVALLGALGCSASPNSEELSYAQILAARDIPQMQEAVLVWHAVAVAVGAEPVLDGQMTREGQVIEIMDDRYYRRPRSIVGYCVPADRVTELLALMGDDTHCRYGAFEHIGSRSEIRRTDKPKLTEPDAVQRCARAEDIRIALDKIRFGDDEDEDE